jgi:hypothetical protein
MRLHGRHRGPPHPLLGPAGASSNRRRCCCYVSGRAGGGRREHCRRALE